MLTASPSMKSTTPHIDTPTGEFESCSAVPVTKLCFAHETARPSSCGEGSKTTASTLVQESGKTASTVRRSGTKERIKARNSYVRRMRLLIAAGLIAGITPTSTRKGSSQGILDIASFEPDGSDAASPREAL